MHPSFLLEDHYMNQGYGTVAGVDEAGCGPWAGPVVAATFIFLKPERCAQVLLSQIHDSKKLTARQRCTIAAQFSEMKGDTIDYAVGCASVTEIDQMNIGQATRLAMERSLVALATSPSCILVDGIRKPHIPVPAYLIPKGDQKSFSIAAASIIAKVHRDRIMEGLHEKFPYYGWKTNMGYGTKVHQEALAAHGVTIHHRTSFNPVAKYLLSK